MLLLTILLLAIATNSTGPVAAAIESYKNIESYRVTIMSESKNSSEIIKYYYKKPGLVRMEFIEPHNGAVLVYNPAKKQVRLRPFSFFKSFILTLTQIMHFKKAHL